jgi:hypothetical protein
MPVDPIAAATADAKCREFVEVINQIRDAGLYETNRPFPDCVFDADGKLWPIPPTRMTVGDIFEYVEHRFGSLFVGFCKSRDDFTVH